MLLRVLKVSVDITGASAPLSSLITISWLYIFIGVVSEVCLMNSVKESSYCSSQTIASDLLHRTELQWPLLLHLWQVTCMAGQACFRCSHLLQYEHFWLQLTDSDDEIVNWGRWLWLFLGHLVDFHELKAWIETSLLGLFCCPHFPTLLYSVVVLVSVFWYSSNSNSFTVLSSQIITFSMAVQVLVEYI